MEYMTGALCDLEFIFRSRGVPKEVAVSPLEEGAYKIVSEGGSVPFNSLRADSLSRAAFMAGDTWDAVDEYNRGFWVQRSGPYLQLWQANGKTVGGKYLRKMIAERDIEEAV